MPMPLHAGLAVAIYDPSAPGGTVLQAALALARVCWHIRKGEAGSRSLSCPRVNGRDAAPAIPQSRLASYSRR